MFHLPEPSRLIFWAAALTLVAPVVRADAQCPNGTPPPCRGARVATASREVNPPLDERTWIVVPFDNLAQSADIEWLRAASVNLLYMDLSRWRDIRVVDDERVADLLREVPEARGAPRMSLAAALAVARRAGAGRLVMGDLLKVGSRIAVVAKVFDVRGGRRLRSVREEASVQDSLIPTFGRVARGIIEVAPASGENVGVVGTSSIEAYQEYLSGVQALNRFDLPEARRRFTRSLQLDSLFALPHYKLSIVINWENPSDPARRVHADAAVRLGNVLPPRERALVSALRKFAVADYAGACAEYGALVRSDSADVEALYGVGECTFHDEALEPVEGDSSRFRFRGSWNTSVRAFRRVLQLDPGNYLAFQHILDVLGAESRAGCLRPVASAPCAGAIIEYQGIVRRLGDSLVIEPVHVAIEGQKLYAQMDEAERTRARVGNLEEARGMAEEWVAVAPLVARARTSLGHVYVLLGRYDEADRQFALAKGEFPAMELFQIILDRLEIAIRRGRGAEVQKLLDSAGRAYQGKAVPSSVPVALALANAIVGRLGGFDTLIATFGVPPVIVRYYQKSLRTLITGSGGDSTVAAERETFDFLAGAGAAFAGQATNLIAPTLGMGLRLPRASWPAIVVDPRERGTIAGAALMPALALARGDSQEFRRATRALDSAATAPVGGISRLIAAVTAAQAHMMLADSQSALRLLRHVVDSAFAKIPITATLNSTFGPAGIIWPRAILDRADLARELGFRDEAREWYRRFIDLWVNPDPEFAPLMVRVRAAYASVGGT